MNRTVLFLACFLFNGSLMAQKERGVPPLSPIRIAMTAEKWSLHPGTCEFLQHRSVPAMRLLTQNNQVVLKDLSFANGTIEYDMEPESEDFSSIFFRRRDSTESELFYIRLFAIGVPNVMATVQYTPVIGAAICWDLLPYCQGAANLVKGQWNHVKMVVSGSQMLVYVNDLIHPTCEITQLEGNTKTGNIAFSGKALIANLVVTPDATEGLSPVAGADPFYNDTRYIRQWSVSQPVDLPKGRELTNEDLPKQNTEWTKITTERRGLVNLTRLYGNSTTRRVVWLKCRLKAPMAQNRIVDFGFTNEVWIFLNGKIAMVDKNFFGAVLEKRPRARCSTENTSFTLPLQAGDNEILIGIANDSFGWGIIARLDTMDGIEVL
jgi:hypothetical protein